MKRMVVGIGCLVALTVGCGQQDSGSEGPDKPKPNVTAEAAVEPTGQEQTVTTPVAEVEPVAETTPVAKVEPVAETKPVAKVEPAPPEETKINSKVKMELKSLDELTALIQSQQGKVVVIDCWSIY
ncbi:MAG: hypothetical protein N2C14_27665 [Planctomycetales bacterium]